MTQFSISSREELLTLGLAPFPEASRPSLGPLGPPRQVSPALPNEASENDYKLSLPRGNGVGPLHPPLARQKQTTTIPTVPKLQVVSGLTAYNSKTVVEVAIPEPALRKSAVNSIRYHLNRRLERQRADNIAITYEAGGTQSHEAMEDSDEYQTGLEIGRTWSEDSTRF
ncbi:hypothetical protein TWF481_002623 [Arthrobotrys musiformis]|uniref:Uncharacterized protein n=1 Tax=Arthrobotrys musiformis TaxID=47236 RepID=A0AAV9VQQ1_9PEZI